MRELVAPWVRYGFMLLLGLIPSLVLGLLVWFMTQADQAAAADLARYQAAPRCAGLDAGPDCRVAITATVISTYTLPLEQSTDTHVLIGDGGDQTWDVQPVSDTGAWLPGQTIQAEAWQGQIVLMRATDGRRSETLNHPAQTRARTEGTTGVARLAGVLGLLWAVCFVGLFVAVARPSTRIERPERSRPGADP